MKKKWWKHCGGGIIFSVLFISVLLSVSSARAETEGKGARIIQYGVPEQARFHLGDVVGSSVELAAEATGTKKLTDIVFTSSDTSVCSITAVDGHWKVERLKEGTSVIRMSCKADNDTVVRTLLVSSFTPLTAEEDDPIMGMIREGAVIYYGCSDVEGISSASTEVKTIMAANKEAEVVYKCGDYYRVELEEETFGDSDEMWGYVKKDQVYIPVVSMEAAQEQTFYERETVSMGVELFPAIATNKDIEYQSSNTNVAVVDAGGSITGVHRGSAVITATSLDNRNIISKCRVTVKTYVPVTGIRLTPAALEIDDGTTGKLTASVLPEDASVPDYSWQVSRDDIFQIDSKGRYRALKPGRATVTATTKEGNFSAVCEVTVREVAAQGVYLQSELSLDTGEIKTPVWRMVPANATNKNVSWSSDNPAVARVDPAGRVTAVSTGTATIYIETEEGRYRAGCKVTVEIYVRNIRLKDTAMTMTAGTKKQLRADISPAERTKEKIIWKSQDPDVVSVSQTGEIRARRAGKTKVIVYDRYRGAYDFAIIHVKVNLKKPGLKGKKKGKKFVLSWKKVKNATGYKIYKYRKKEKRYVKIKSLGADKRLFTVKKAKKGAKYKIQACYKANGITENSKFSPVVRVK